MKSLNKHYASFLYIFLLYISNNYIIVVSVLFYTQLATVWNTHWIPCWSLGNAIGVQKCILKVSEHGYLVKYVLKFPI